MVKKKIVLSALVLLFIAGTTSTSADLSYANAKAYAGSYGPQVSDYVNDSLNYLNLTVHSVYPSNTDRDNYEYVRVKLYRSNGTTLNINKAEYVVKEGSTAHRIDMKYSSFQTNVKWTFKGNQPNLGANVTFSTN